MRRQRSGSVVQYTIIAAVLACGVAAGCSSPPPDMTVNGTLEIAVYQAESPQQEYPQAWNGNAQVTVTDPSGKVIAVTTADGQNSPQQTPTAETQYLTYGFTVKVPEGLSFYGISVTGGNGTVQFTPAQMKQGPAVCLGDACGS